MDIEKALSKLQKLKAEIIALENQLSSSQTQETLAIAKQSYADKLEAYSEAYKTALDICTHAKYPSVLIRYYINGEKISDIADSMNYTARSIRRMKKISLEELERNIKQ